MIIKLPSLVAMAPPVAIQTENDDERQLLNHRTTLVTPPAPPAPPWGEGVPLVRSNRPHGHPPPPPPFVHSCTEADDVCAES
eukprot:COSAG02_NODE_3395_length_6814_cov_8.576620_3_plen_82_part_00